MLSGLMNDKIRVVKPDGTTSGWLQASVTRGEIVVGAETVIEEGDIVERDTSVGIERHEVEEATFFENFHGIPAHYQLRVVKRTKTVRAKPSQSTVHVQGDGNTVVVGSTDTAINVGGDSVLLINPSLTREWGILAVWGVGGVLRY